MLEAGPAHVRLCPVVRFAHAARDVRVDRGGRGARLLRRLGGPASFRPQHAARGASRWDSAVIVLPLEAPLRVAEDAAVLDALSAGRLQLGFGAQHHFRAEYGRPPSPLVLLAAIAQRTRRIELGTGLVTLPLEDPLRLAEDATVLDVLSIGRVQLRLGSGGANTDAFSAFGIDAGTRQTRFAALLERLEQALSGTPLAPAVSAAADARNTDDQNDAAQAAPLRLQPPAAGLRERLRHSHSSPEGARLAAAHGNGLLLGTAVHDPRGVQLPLAQAYLAAWRERADATSRAPRLGVVRAVFPAAD